MARSLAKIAKTATLLVVAAVGCARQSSFVDRTPLTSVESADELVKQVSYEEELADPSPRQASFASMPFVLNSDPSSINYWDLTLDEAIQLALSNASVLRDLGAAILQAPGLASTAYDPSIQATDPQFGSEAALSAFDAEFSTQAFFEQNNRALNNALLGGGTNFFEQDLWRIQSQLRKQTATGTIFSLRHNMEDDLNNAPQNIFGTAGTVDAHAWTWITEAEVRQPLLQGRGTQFNRIAGPDAQPGIYDGVVIARVNQDISSADFQLAVRNYLSDVENAYWELVYAYRELDAMKKARDRSLETWQQIKERQAQGIKSDQVGSVDQAAEQYYRYQQEVELALTGRPIDATRGFNGSTGGTFQGVGGVYVAERRLRLIIGIPINDGRLIRPVTEPVPAKLVLDWDELSNKALQQRTELVRQRLRVKRRDLELISSRNFLLPRFDAVGVYRRRGLGDALYDPNVPNPMDPTQNVGSGRNEWQLGLELALPIGYRQANSAVRNAELSLARERAILVDMERQIVHDLSNAVSEQELSFQYVQTAYNRRVAAEHQLELLTAEPVSDAGRVDFNILLDSVRRFADAETTYDRAVVGYAVAIKNLHVEVGDLMEYCNVHYSETP